jgi:hypothetical protein
LRKQLKIIEENILSIIKNIIQKKEIIFIFANDLNKLLLKIWGGCRINKKSLNPIIAFGVLSKKYIMNQPECIFFEHRENEYNYIELPLNIFEFICIASRVNPLLNDSVRERHISRYYDKKGLIGYYYHQLDNAIRELNNEKIEEINNIIKYLNTIK